MVGNLLHDLRVLPGDMLSNADVEMIAAAWKRYHEPGARDLPPLAAQERTLAVLADALLDIDLAWRQSNRAATPGAKVRREYMAYLDAQRSARTLGQALHWTCESLRGAPQPDLVQPDAFDWSTLPARTDAQGAQDADWTADAAPEPGSYLDFRA